jgi:membrane fusion protein (multidrug efflux system)
MQRKHLLLAAAGLVAAVAIVGWAGVWALSGPSTKPTAQQVKGQAEKGGRKRGAERAVAVEAAVARGAVTTTDIRAIGSLRSDESVLIASEIAGRIEEIAFTEGGNVSAGDVLIKLDDDLAQAELAAAKARFDFGQAEYDRTKKLSGNQFATVTALDKAESNLETTRATFELARVRLAKHTIKAPFPGRVGLRKVSPGSYIGIGTTIVNLEKIDVLKVDFKLPELFLPSVSVGQMVDVIVDAQPGRTFTGEIYAIDPQVDVNGRALALRARLQNADLLLRPGLFARVLVKGKQTREVVLAPESALVPRSGVNFVFRIDHGKAVEVKVKLGERRGAEVEILEGLTPDALVVTAGQLKLRNGDAVEVVDGALEPAARTSAKRDGT